jgi:predicted transcriptional regulator
MKVDRAASIKLALAEAISSVSDGTSEEVLEKVLSALDKQKLLRYHNEDSVNLFSTAGKVLVAIIEDPTMTVRAISVYLDISETMVDKSVKALISDGLISKTKVQRQNIYKINFYAVKNHQDMKHVFDVLKIVHESTKEDKVHTVQNSEDEVF